jgi:membrane fusion protein (multidrug efflux system)
VLYEEPADAVVVTENAVTFTLYGNTLFVVTPKLGGDGKPLLDEDGQPLLIANRRAVDTGERRNGLVEVRKGLQAGEQVVSNGQLKLNDGTLVKLVADPALRKPAAN